MSERGLGYAQWVERWRWLILGVSLLVAAGGLLLALRLPIHSEFSHLLPPSRKSVQDLEALRDRVSAFGTVFVVIEGDSAEATDRAGADLLRRLQGMDPAVAAHVTGDDGAARRFAWEHRFLFAELADLTDARDALRARIHAAKLKANPFYVDLEAGDQPPEAEIDARIASLRTRLDDAEARARSPSRFLSDDGTAQLFIVRSTAPTTEIDESTALVSAVNAAAAETRRQVPGVAIGLTGDVYQTYLEHRAIMRGIGMAAAITGVLIALGLLLYYRSGLAVLGAMWALAVGVLATFAVAWLTIGHLNVMSAFLVAIVAGNGMNAGLILLSRYFEEVRAGHDGAAGLGRALAGSLGGTLAATLAAGVAYGALMVTEFRGFRHFGVIASVGMVLCWLSAYTVMPAALMVLARRRRLRPSREPAFGRLAGLLAPARGLRATLVGLGLTAVAAAIAVVYVAADPLENDWRRLRSDSGAIRESQRLDEVMRTRIDKRFSAALSTRFVVAVEHRAEAGEVAATLRAAGLDLIAGVTTIDDLLPRDQPAKVAVLAEIEGLLDDEVIGEIDATDRALLERVRPPAGLRALVEGDVPTELAWPFTEKDGERGRLLQVAASTRFQTWNVRHRLELAEGVRALDLPDDVVVGGQSFVIADIIAAMQRDAPLASLLAVAGAVVVVCLLVGVRRHGRVTLVAGAAGVLWMIALCAAIGVKVNFLDLVALPITIGIGVDYAVNLAARHRQQPHIGARELLTTTGGAVMLCSFTTTVGYGSLLLSQNAGIRSFGLAAILGEVACLAAALVLVPPLLARVERSRSGPGVGKIT